MRPLVRHTFRIFWNSSVGCRLSVEKGIEAAHLSEIDNLTSLFMALLV